MEQTTIYKSRFAKADTRELTNTAEGSVSVTAFPGYLEVRDVFVMPGCAMTPAPGKYGGLCLVMPVAGEASLQAPDADIPLAPGQILALPPDMLNRLIVRNAFDDETINFLVFDTRLPLCSGLPRIEEIELSEMNALVSPAEGHIPVRLGIYDSRTKGAIDLGAADSTALGFVINGSFEIEERLLEYRDALLLRDTQSIGFESLSEAAILLQLTL